MFNFSHSITFNEEVSQFAKTIDARVIATTSSDAKTIILKELEIDHVINYITDSE